MSSRSTTTVPAQPQPEAKGTVTAASPLLLARHRQPVPFGPRHPLHAVQINGCVYCVDMHSREALRTGESQDRLLQLPVWKESELYDERERAALGYAEAATRREHIGDEQWEALRKAFPDEAELGHLIAQVSLINALNLIGVPLQMRPPRH